MVAAAGVSHVMPGMQEEAAEHIDAGTEPPREQMFKPKSVVTVSRRTLVIAGIVVLLAITAGAAA
jgi:hypothetical protein